MKKVLFVATVAQGHIVAFHPPYLKWFKEQGWEVSVAAGNDYENPADCVIPYCDHYYEMPFLRNPFKPGNLQVYRRLKKLITANKYDIVHCHTPVGGLLARLAARRARRSGTTVIYTVHGFHFYKGAPLINWLLYYPIERFLAGYTDCLITINSEDYNLAKRFKAKRMEQVNGVGVDLSKFCPATKDEKSATRKQYGYTDEHFILLYAARFDKDKNHRFLVDAMRELINSVPNARLLLPGNGPLIQSIRNRIEQLGLENHIRLPGYCKNMLELCRMADLQVSPSVREGLGINLAEGMASGLPIVCADNRGHRELITPGKNGFIFTPGDTVAFTQAIIALHGNPSLRNSMGANALQDARKFSIENTVRQMEGIYGYG